MLPNVVNAIAKYVCVENTRNLGMSEEISEFNVTISCPNLDILRSRTAL